MGQSSRQAAGSQVAAAGENAYNRSLDAGGLDVGRVSPWTASGTAAAQQINALLGLGSLQSTGDKYNNFNVAGGYGGADWQGAQKDALARFQTDPGYQFRVQQGVNALDNSAAARGGVLSGAQKIALANYGQNAGSQEYGNYFNRLAGVSGQGLTAANAANTAYNQAVIPGIAQANQGQQGQAAYNVAGSDALSAGILGAQNSLLNLAAYGGAGGGFGIPNFGTGSAANKGGTYSYGPVQMPYA